MSTLSVTTVQTANTTTDLTLRTGNTSAASFLVYSNNTVVDVLGGSFPTISVKGTGTTQFAGAYINLLATGANANVAGTKFLHVLNTGAGDLGDTSFQIQQVNSTSGFINTQYLIDYKNATQTWGINGTNRASLNSTSFALLNNTTLVTSNVNVTTNNFTLGTASATANGYTRLPNGILMQWGSQTASVNATITATITFPVAFTTFYSLSIDGIGATAAGNNAILNAAPNTTAAVWRSLSTAAASSITVYYVAIGS